MKTYADAAAVLHTFLAASPDPAAIGAGTSPKDRLYRALIDKTGSFGAPPPPRHPAGPAQAGNPVAELAEAVRVALTAVFEVAVPWRDAAIFDKGKLGASWYRKAAQPGGEAPSSGWTLDDSLSVAETFAFALPEVGALVSGGIGLMQHLIDSGSSGAPDPHQHADDSVDRVVGQIERFLSKKTVSDELRDVIRRATNLKSNMDLMLADPQRVAGATRGLRPDWVADSHAKEWVLGPEFIGDVWTIVGSNAFISLMAESSDTPYADPLNLNLAGADDLSPGLCTVDAYAQITGIVVNALILYSLVCLMPGAALRPGWDPKTFDLMAAVRSPRWRRTPNSDPGRSAYDCWETLHTYLDPKKKPSWVTRVDPVNGDARQAFDLIKARLDCISFGFGLPKQRDDLWFLQNDTSTGIELHGSDVHHSDPDGAFRAQCADHQSEAKDTVLSTKYDTFAEPYRGFKTSLDIHWSVGGSAADVAVGIVSLGSVTAGDAAAAASLNQSHGRIWSPWNGSGDGGVPDGSYNQLCWCPDVMVLQEQSPNHYGGASLLEDATLLITSPAFADLAKVDLRIVGQHTPAGFMDNSIGRDAVGWMGFVLAHYIADLNYKVDVRSGFSTFTVAKLFYDAWIKVHDYAATLLEAGAES